LWEVVYSLINADDISDIRIKRRGRDKPVLYPQRRKTMKKISS
tara:strand:+ start:355 stop:483 length:129 start_codon:yes stop_codon:yes gene_type:complete